MANAVGYECDECGGLFRDVFTVIVESDKHQFTFGEQIRQPRIAITICANCFENVGEVLNHALCR